MLFNKNGIIKQAQLAKEIQANAEAKSAVTSYSTLRKYIGTKITYYNPTAGANTIEQENEHCVAWLCDPDVWNNNYKIDQADYAIGSPSVEMYMKSI